MRPNTLDDFVGQPHLTGEKGVLRKMLSNKSVPSLILWGPPGVGKTTLAQLIAEGLDMPFFTLSAISAGVKEVRELNFAFSMISQIALKLDLIDSIAPLLDKYDLLPNFYQAN